MAKIPGWTGILTANPYYNRPGQEGQFQHFRAIAEAVELPILLLQHSVAHGHQHGAGDGAAAGRTCECDRRKGVERQTSRRLPRY